MGDENRLVYHWHNEKGGKREIFILSVWQIYSHLIIWCRFPFRNLFSLFNGKLCHSKACTSLFAQLSCVVVWRGFYTNIYTSRLTTTSPFPPFFGFGVCMNNWGWQWRLKHWTSDLVQYGECNATIPFTHFPCVYYLYCWNLSLPPSTKNRWISTEFDFVCGGERNPQIALQKITTRSLIVVGGEWMNKPKPAFFFLSLCHYRCLCSHSIVLHFHLHFISGLCLIYPWRNQQFARTKNFGKKKINTHCGSVLFVVADVRGRS